MIGHDEAQLAAYLRKREGEAYGRRLLSRFFEGKVLSADLAQAPGQLSVQPAGEDGGDGILCPLLTTAYRPAVGERVQCIWLDETTAAVLAPLSLNVQSGRVVDLQVVSGSSVIIPRDLPALPPGYTKARIGFVARSDSGNTTDFVYARANGDGAGTALYNWHIVRGEGGSAPVSVDGLGNDQWIVGVCQGGAQGAGQAGHATVEIEGYAQTTYRSGFTSSNYFTASGYAGQYVCAGHYATTDNIWQLQLWPSAGSWVDSLFITEIL